MEEDQVIQKAFGAVKWATLANFIPRAITPLSTLLLAALLTPEDFGTVAAATVVISLAKIVVGLGMGAAVIQRRELVAEAASVALALSLSLALALYIGLWIASPHIAQIFKNSALVDVLRVSGLALVLNALYSIPNALLRREMLFKQLFWIMVIPRLTTAAVSVTLAFLGANYWALVWGILAGQLGNAILAWVYCSWRPKLFFQFKLVRSLLSFSLWIVFSGFLSWLSLYADNAIAGYFLGTKGLGQYSLGFNIANLIPGMILGALSAVAYPAFSALQSNPSNLGSSLLQTQFLAAAIVFPINLGIATLAIPVVSLMYGDKWPDLGWIMTLLVIMPGISHLWSLNADAFRAIGKPEAWAKAAGISLLVALPLLVLAGQFGVRSFVIARVMGAILYPLLIILATRRVLGLRVVEQLSGYILPLGCGLAMFIVILPLRQYFFPYTGLSGWLKVFIIAATGAGIYTILLWLLGRDLFIKVLSSAKRVLSPA